MQIDLNPKEREYIVERIEKNKDIIEERKGIMPIVTSVSWCFLAASAYIGVLDIDINTIKSLSELCYVLGISLEVHNLFSRVVASGLNKENKKLEQFDIRAVSKVLKQYEQEQTNKQQQEQGGKSR